MLNPKSLKMKNLNLIKLFVGIVFMTMIIMSCEKDKNTTPLGFEVTGTSSFDGIYKIRTDKDDWFVREDDDRYVLKKIFQEKWDNQYGWILIFDNEYLTYRNIGDTDFPPIDSWECGVGVDKPGVRVNPIYE